MADNYLEKRMEEHRARQAATSVRTITGGAVRRGLPFKPLRVFLPDALRFPETACAIINSFVGAGCTVAFNGDDMRKGQMLAQRSGARFYPMTASEASTLFGDSELSVQIEHDRIMLCLINGDRVEITPSSADAAPLCLLMSATGARRCNATIKTHLQHQ